jgi:hypothetical protein
VRTPEGRVQTTSGTGEATVSDDRPSTRPASALEVVNVGSRSR